MEDLLGYLIIVVIVLLVNVFSINFGIILGVIILVVVFIGMFKKKKDTYDADVNEILKIIKSKKYNNNEDDEDDEDKYVKKYDDSKNKEFIDYICSKLRQKGYRFVICDIASQYIDIATIDQKTKAINLIQCKTWHSDYIDDEDIEEFYKNFDKNDFLRNIDGFEMYEDPRSTQPKDTIDLTNYKRRKTLYLSAESLNLGDIKAIEKIKNNIYKYKSMKIIVLKH